MLPGCVHGQPVLRDDGVRVFAIRRSIVAGRGQPGDAFRVGLLRRLALARQVDQIRTLAHAIAHADHGRISLIDGFLQGSEDIGRIHENDICISRHRARPFQVQVGFRQIVLADAGIGLPRHQNLLQINSRQIELAAERLDIGKIDVGLSHDDQLLARSIHAGGVKRRDVVNSGEVVRSNLVFPVGGGIPRSHARPVCCVASAG